jgi:hypothetical protein
MGPFFIDGNLNGTKNLELLRVHIIPQIQDLNIENVWFHMDGALPHSTRAITTFLNEAFENRWISRFEPTVWPARSPDLSPNDFFLWAYLKSKVYDNVVIQNVQVKTRFRGVCNDINPNCLRNASQGFHRLAYCLESEGGHFEHLS